MAVGNAVSAERNIITVLAVDMVGSTRHIAACDPDDAQAFLDQWLDHVRSSVERVGGQIVHYAGDGGIAIFGWPSAYEDHADRACIAAWDIQSHREATGPGGTSGSFSRRGSFRPGRFAQRRSECYLRFRCCRRDRARRGQITASSVSRRSPGQRRNRPDCAARHSTSRRTRHLRRSPIRLIEVYRLNARPRDVDHNDAARRYQNPIVDRVDELAALRERLPRLGGNSTSVALIGEPGIGKSRLAAAAMSDALTSDVRCCVFYGAVQRRTTSFAAARALVGDMLGAGSLSSDDAFPRGARGIWRRDRRSQDA